MHFLEEDVKMRKQQLLYQLQPQSTDVHKALHRQSLKRARRTKVVSQKTSHPDKSNPIEDGIGIELTFLSY